MYAPYLAWAIHQHNEEAKFNSTLLHINLKGFIVANGATDWNTDPFVGTVDTLKHFNLISPDLYRDYKELKCKYLWKGLVTNIEGKCYDIMLKIAGTFNLINIYNLLEPFEVAVATGKRSQKRSFDVQDFLRDMHDPYFN